MDRYANVWGNPTRTSIATPSAANFTDANSRRAHTAAARTVPQASAALRVPGLPPCIREVLRLRVEHPDLTLAQLAGHAGLSKDQFAGRFRRGLAMATRKNQPQHRRGRAAGKTTRR